MFADPPAVSGVTEARWAATNPPGRGFPGCRPVRLRGYGAPGSNRACWEIDISTPDLLRSHRTYRREHPRGAAGPRPLARLIGLSVVDGADQTTQRDALQRLGLDEDEFAQGIFARSGVRQRQLNLEADFLERNLQGRAAEVEQELLEQAILAIDQLDVDLAEVGTLLTSSLYSLGCPSLAHRLIEHYRMSPSTDKYHITGVGCASAVPLMRLAAQTLQGDASRKVLVVAAESMSSILMPAREDDPRAKTVGSAIFGDGCAAALLGGDGGPAGPAILASHVHQIPNTLEAVTLSSDAGDSHLDLARELPEIAGEELADLVVAFLRSNGLTAHEVSHWMLHPGGRRILEHARDALGLDDVDIDVSWRALADHGNVGTPSIFYVLHRTLKERSPARGDYGLLVTIGPGVSVGMMLLQF
jgi:alkylresorcinol/alkylpyrone synthase